MDVWGWRGWVEKVGKVWCALDGLGLVLLEVEFFLHVLFAGILSIVGMDMIPPSNPTTFYTP